MSTSLLDYDRAHRTVHGEAGLGAVCAPAVAAAAGTTAPTAPPPATDARRRGDGLSPVPQEQPSPSFLAVQIDWGMEPQPGRRLRPEFSFAWPSSAGVPEIRMLLDEHLDQAGWTERPQAQRREQTWRVEQSLCLNGRNGVLLPGVYGIEMMVRSTPSGGPAGGYQGWLKFRLSPEAPARNRRFELVLDESAASVEGLAGLLQQRDEVSLRVSKSVLQAQGSLEESLRQVLAPPAAPAAVTNQAECRLWPTAELRHWDLSHQPCAPPTSPAAPAPPAARTVQIGRTRHGVRLQMHGRAIDDAALLRLNEIVPAMASAQAGVAVPACLADLAELHWLDLANTGVTDRSLAQVNRLTSLRALYLDGTAITDEGLALLQPLLRLQTLSLADTGIGDRGLQAVRCLAELEVLLLNRTEITDAELEVWLANKRLKRVALGCCPRISPRMIAAARSRRPDLDLDY